MQLGVKVIFNVINKIKQLDLLLKVKYIVGNKQYRWVGMSFKKNIKESFMGNIGTPDINGSATTS